MPALMKIMLGGSALVRCRAFIKTQANRTSRRDRVTPDASPSVQASGRPFSYLHCCRRLPCSHGPIVPTRGAQHLAVIRL